MSTNIPVVYYGYISKQSIIKGNDSNYYLDVDGNTVIVTCVVEQQSDLDTYLWKDKTFVAMLTTCMGVCHFH